MNKELLLNYLILFFFITVSLYTFTHFLGVLNNSYFLKNQDSLTTIKTIPSTDGGLSSGANYYYKKTPFFFPYRMSTYGSLVVPIFLLFLFSIKFFKKNKTKKNYLTSLLFPCLYGITNILFFLLVTDPSLGWEYSVGLFIVFIWSIFIFTTVSIVNGIILYKNKK